MSSDDQAEHDNRREFTRLRSSAECLCVFGGKESRAVLVDASRGGCKLRFDDAPAAMAAILPVPCEVIIRDELSGMPATVMWAGGDLAGCRFHQLLSLDEAARMRNGQFHMEVLREPVQMPRTAPAPQERAESAAETEARLEAEMAARVRMMLDADGEESPTPPS